MSTENPQATPTALVITDPQNDFLSPDGVTWGVVGNTSKRGAYATISEHFEENCKAPSVIKIDAESSNAGNAPKGVRWCF